MKIGIDGNEANVDTLVGVSVYTYNLLKWYSKKADTDIQFIIYLREEPKKHLPKESPFFQYRVIKSTFLWSQIFLPLYLYGNNEVNVFFSPAHYSPRFCPVPTVVTIHDVSYFYYPDEFLQKDLFKLKNWTRDSLSKAKKIIAVSKTTKKDIIKFYDVSEKKIDVVYNGFEKEISEQNDKKNPLTEFKLEKSRYILYVGTLQPRKNIQTLVKAFKKFQLLYPEYKLVITGRKGWLYEDIFHTVQQEHLEEHVIFTDYVSDSEVAQLYRNAFCFVLPSLYEGFGIPLLEAMSYKCPVITSHSSSLPEIGGDACLYFNAPDEKDLYEDLNLLKKDESIRKELIQKGTERITFFSWEKCAEETLEIIKQAASSI